MHRSEFEMLATILNQDRYFMDSDHEQCTDLLQGILRLCHDYNDSRYADFLAESISSIIYNSLATSDFVEWPEEEGSGVAKWKTVGDITSDKPHDAPEGAPNHAGHAGGQSAGDNEAARQLEIEGLPE